MAAPILGFGARTVSLCTRRKVRPFSRRVSGFEFSVSCSGGRDSVRRARETQISWQVVRPSSLADTRGEGGREQVICLLASARDLSEYFEQPGVVYNEGL